MKIPHRFGIIPAILVPALLIPLSGCSGGDNGGESGYAAAEQLSSPSTFAISGAGSATVDSTSYVFASSDGTIDTSTNTVTATFTDPYTPLSLGSTTAFFDQMNTGSCNSLSTLTAAVAGSSSNEVTTNLSATGCTDQATLNVILDTTQVYDNAGLDGSDTVSLSVTVDVAPKVDTGSLPTGYDSGTSTTESSAGDFAIGTDTDIVVTFSKSLASGTWNATLTGGCGTLGTGAPVSGTNNQTIAWPVSSPSTGSCTFNVSGVADSVGNSEDPLDPNISTTITFH